MDKKYGRLSILLMIAVIFLELGLSQGISSEAPYHHTDHGIPSSIFIKPDYSDIELDYLPKLINNGICRSLSDMGRIRKNSNSRSMNGNGVHFDTIHITLFFRSLLAGGIFLSFVSEYRWYILLVLNYIHEQDGKK